MGEIIVGVDGSEHAHRALGWALAEAALRGSVVRAVHSWRFPPATKGPDGLPHADIAGTAERVIDDAVAAALAEVPDASGVTIEREVAGELPAQALIRCSEGAELVVVGSRGLGGFKGLLLGSVADQVAHHARCPVVIVPPADRT